MPSLVRLKLVNLAGNGDSVALDAPSRICQIAPKMESANSGQEAEFHPGCKRPLERPEGHGPAQPRAPHSLPKPGGQHRKARRVPRKAVRPAVRRPHAGASAGLSNRRWPPARRTVPAPVLDGPGVAPSHRVHGERPTAMQNGRPPARGSISQRQPILPWLRPGHQAPA